MMVPYEKLLLSELRHRLTLARDPAEVSRLKREMAVLEAQIRIMEIVQEHGER